MLGSWAEIVGDIRSVENRSWGFSLSPLSVTVGVGWLSDAIVRCVGW